MFKKETKRNLKNIILAVALLVIGLTAMFLLAYFEEEIQIKLPRTAC